MLMMMQGLGKVLSEFLPGCRGRHSSSSVSGTLCVGRFPGDLFFRRRRRRGELGWGWRLISSDRGPWWRFWDWLAGGRYRSVLCPLAQT